MSAGFTPGPWRIERVTGYLAIRADATPLRIADCGETNVNLIASAPDLYEALVELEDHSMLNREENEMVSAALAKARGGQS